MLASLLCNIPIGTDDKPRVRPKQYYDRFFNFDGVTYDAEDKPERETIKRIAKCLGKIDFEAGEFEEAKTITKELLSDEFKTARQRLEEVVKYRKLAEMIKRRIRETEEEELVLLLLELY